jgi:hypothetical protein
MLASEPQMIQYIYVHTVRRALSFEHGGIVSRHVGAKHKAGARVVTTCTSIAARLPTVALRASPNLVY